VVKIEIWYSPKESETTRNLRVPAVGVELCLLQVVIREKIKKETPVGVCGLDAKTCLLV